LRFDMWEPDSFELHKAMKYEEAVAEYGPTTKLKRAFVYKALNRLIQGSAADLTKASMVKLFEQGVVPLLQVHDELCFSVETKEQAEQYARAMETAITLEVPSKCDIDWGPSWGEARPMEPEKN
jgi:DNA polymerase I-like protein with 3'-5' exonuclease and polymerase domains